MSVKINSLEFENVKKIKAVQLEPAKNGHKWDSISGAEQLIVATSIVRKLNPDCGFVLLDKLEQMDTDTLEDFGKWLEAQGLQAIATRVSTGDECSIIIEDGRSMDNDKEENTETKTWKAGAF